jgi:hypothetical protein
MTLRMRVLLSGRNRPKTVRISGGAALRFGGASLLRRREQLSLCRFFLSIIWLRRWSTGPHRPALPTPANAPLVPSPPLYRDFPERAPPRRPIIFITQIPKITVQTAASAAAHANLPLPLIHIPRPQRVRSPDGLPGRLPLYATNHNGSRRSRSREAAARGQNETLTPSPTKTIIHNHQNHKNHSSDSPLPALPPFAAKQPTATSRSKAQSS